MPNQNSTWRHNIYIYIIWHSKIACSIVSGVFLHRGHSGLFTVFIRNESSFVKCFLCNDLNCKYLTNVPSTFLSNDFIQINLMSLLTDFYTIFLHCNFGWWSGVLQLINCRARWHYHISPHIKYYPFQCWGYFRLKHEVVKIFEKHLKPVMLWCWYSLDNSSWVLSEEYPCTRISVIFHVDCIILYWLN